MKYKSWARRAKNQASQTSVAAKRLFFQPFYQDVELSAPQCQARWSRLMVGGAEINTWETTRNHRQLSSCRLEESKSNGLLVNLAGEDHSLSYEIYRGQKKSMQSSWSRPCFPSSLLCRSYGVLKSCTQVYTFSTRSLEDESIPSSCDYSSLLQEQEFHKLADELLSHLHEKVDELGEQHDVDGFDTDHADGVLTIKLGALGTYVINKQTPNRQIWLSSPVSGPARFDWDATNQRWIYKRTMSELLSLLESELSKLLGGPVSLSLESE